MVGSPIPPDVTSIFTDAEWLAAMRQHDAGRGSPGWDLDEGSADELSWVLRQVRSDGPRFARLIDWMEDGIDHAYFSAILEGLLEVVDLSEADRPAQESAIPELGTDLLLRVVRRLHDLPERPCGRQISRVFGRMADRQIPPAEFTILEHYALNDPDPRSRAALADWQPGQQRDAHRLHMLGIDSVRGSAIQTMADLLIGDYTRLDTRLPLMQKTTRDQSLAVRACLFQALIPLLNHEADRPTAVRLCLESCHDTDDLLVCGALEGFLHYATIRHYSDLGPLLQRMLSAGDSNSVKAGTR